jgi:heme/copper-type cytochrome/quinol oxidase subunit 2
MILVIVGVIAGVLLVVCGLIVLVVIIVRRRKSNSNKNTVDPNSSNDHVDSHISLEPIRPNRAESHYSSIGLMKTDYYAPLGVEAATSTSSSEKLEKIAKSWEIKYSELQMLEIVGEGAFGTVHRAIFRHQQVAVKQLKNQISRKQVRVQD